MGSPDTLAGSRRGLSKGEVMRESVHCQFHMCELQNGRANILPQ